ncbi:hypothetical protein [Roseospira navarrensis]|uniref:Uncharacterized protein n=1 Tax=Roseospira navarrensis TaxID=140058 RepID=A0A7X2D6A5_9PROT|nr:hypothetical protein [Roseospira navarrensis]MQX38095.1 hypothetical protein [Roseospira navarrensis]
MDMTPAEAARARPDHVGVARTLADLYALDRARRPDLLVLAGGLAGPGVPEALTRPDWPLRLVTGLRLPEAHPWLFAGEAERATPEQHRALGPGDLERLARAAGLDGAARGNVRCTWWIRRYDDAPDSAAGSLAFFRDLLTAQETGDLPAALLAALVDLLAAAEACGAALFVEQVTIILAKDPGDGLTTLTPLLHADEYYGPRQTAIASLTEPGWSRRGGALFLPTRRMCDLDALGPLDLDGVDRRLSDGPIVTPGSGDVMIYDGMIGPDGVTDRGRGVPHLSADRAGDSARLVVLMRHVPPG